MPPFAIDRTANMNAALRIRAGTWISDSALNSLIADGAVCQDPKRGVDASRIQQIQTPLG